MHQYQFLVETIKSEEIRRWVNALIDRGDFHMIHGFEVSLFAGENETWSSLYVKYNVAELSIQLDEGDIDLTIFIQELVRRINATY